MVCWCVFQYLLDEQWVLGDTLHGFQQEAAHGHALRLGVGHTSKLCDRLLNWADVLTGVLCDMGGVVYTSVHYDCGGVAFTGKHCDSYDAAFTGVLCDRGGGYSYWCAR